MNDKKFLHLKLRNSASWVRYGHWLKSARCSPVQFIHLIGVVHRPSCWAPQVTQIWTDLHFIVGLLNLKHLAHWRGRSINCRIFLLKTIIFISGGRNDPKDVIKTGETSCVEYFQINWQSSKILMLFDTVISLANSSNGISTGMLNKRNMFVTFSHTTLLLIGTLRNSAMLHTSIAHSTSLVLISMLPALVSLTL